MARLNDFIANVKNEGLMRNNRYEVLFNIPKSVKFYGDLRKVLLYCDNVQLPGVSISTALARTYGEYREMPYEKLFQTISMSFYVDMKMEVKRLFDEWQAGIQDPVTRDMYYYDDYTTQIEIGVIDPNNNTRYFVTLYDAYVKDISPIQMDYSNRDVMKLNVTLNYKYWTSAQGGPATQYEDNISIEDKLRSDLLGRFNKIPDDYTNNFKQYQENLNSAPTLNTPTPETRTVVPQLGGLSLSGASYQAK